METGQRLNARIPPEDENERLLAIAASPNAIGRTGRNENGNLADWGLWSASHPQRDRKVVVCRGRAEWEGRSSRPSNRLSIVSWNILSDTWYRTERDEEYTHTPEECGEWSGRFPLLLRWLESLRPEVIALQEVDYVLFESHFVPSLKDRGYEGRIQRPKKLSEKQPCGNATFWRTDKLQLAGEEHRKTVAAFSHALGVVLDWADGTGGVCVINVHLEAAQNEEGADRRARQMRSALGWAAREFPRSPLVVCGDCNTGADSSLFGVIRGNLWHGHQLASVYEHPSAEKTTPAAAATFAVPGAHYMVDQMWYGHNQLVLECLLDPLTEDEREACLGNTNIPGFAGERGLPNDICPSDHVPIGAVFSFLKRDREQVIPQHAKEQQFQAFPNLARQAELEEKYKGYIRLAPEKAKGKPTPGQISEMKAHALLLKQWIQSLPEVEEKYVLFLKKKSKKK